MSTWRYYEHEGTRWCWNVEPTFHCPNSDLTEYVAAPDGDGDGHRVIVRREDELTEAAQILGMDPLKFAQLVTRAHNSFAHDRERVDGKLTDRCKACGAKMIRDGFRAWVEHLVPEEQRSEQEVRNERVGQRLGLTTGDGTWRRDPPKWFDTKKEAKGWALDEYKIAQARAKESVKGDA